MVIALYFLAYAAIGTFVGGMINPNNYSRDEEAAFWAGLFWPVTLLIVCLFFVNLAGKKIGKPIERFIQRVDS